jgi:hypothetical protein
MKRRDEKRLYKDTLRKKRYQEQLPKKATLGKKRYQEQLPKKATLGKKRYQGQRPKKATLGKKHTPGQRPSEAIIGKKRTSGRKPNNIEELKFAKFRHGNIKVTRAIFRRIKKYFSKVINIEDLIGKNNEYEVHFKLLHDWAKASFRKKKGTNEWEEDYSSNPFFCVGHQ